MITLCEVQSLADADSLFIYGFLLGLAVTVLFSLLFGGFR